MTDECELTLWLLNELKDVWLVEWPPLESVDTEMLTLPVEALSLEGVVFSTWVCTSPLPETLILAWPVPTLTWADPLGGIGTGEPLTVTSTAGTDGLSADAAGLADPEVSRTAE